MSADEDRRDRADTVPNEEREESPARADERDRFLDEELIPILVVGGLVLFLFPEPITSSVGLVLVGVGVGLWFWDLLS